MFHSTPKSRAFTLVEILVVVVIIGIAGAIIVPQMSSRDDLKAAAASRLIMSDLLYLQSLAITRQRNHYARFDTSAQSYMLLDGAGMTVVTHPVSKNPCLMRLGSTGDSGLREARLESAEFRAQAGGTAYGTLGFDELGTPLIYDSGTTQPLVEGSVIVRSGAHKLKVTIASFTGQLAVEPVN